MAYEIDIGYSSDAAGRELNEDFVAAMLPGPGQEGMGLIAAIADGVSSGGMGREAAQTTVTSLVRDYYATPETWDTTVALDRVIGAQNAWLAGVNRQRPGAIGLTTLTALVLRGHSYALAHVGDTRAYLLRGGQLMQLSIDHVVDHPDLKHQLLRALGFEARVLVDYQQGDLLVHDLYLLTSDGVHGVLGTRRLQALMQAPGASAQQIGEGIVLAALQAGTRDNASALVARVVSLQDSTLRDEGRLAQALPMPTRLAVGTEIDGLLVTSLIADNGVNRIHQVRDPASRKLYALKSLHPSRVHDADERAMLAHEAWLAKRIGSSRAAEHLVKLHDELPNGRPRSAFYLLYDWHAGETLQQMIERKQRPAVAQAAAAAMQALKTLGQLHRQGVIHRDVKPANLHQGEDGVLRLLDLGVALSGREPESMRRLHAGTPSYMNPEQWGHHAGAARLGSGGAGTHDLQWPDAQSDLFALGVTLYQLLTGKLPYGEVLPYQAGRYHRDPQAPSRLNPEVPIWLDHVALKAVARDKRLRFETAEEFLLALERGAARPLSAPSATPLMQRDPTALWKAALAMSVLFNLLLAYWLLFLPK